MNEIEKPRERRLPIIDEQTTKRSIRDWNAAKEWRESLKQRERAEVRKKLIRAAKKFGIDDRVLD